MEPEWPIGVNPPRGTGGVRIEAVPVEGYSASWGTLRGTFSLWGRVCLMSAGDSVAAWRTRPELWGRWVAGRLTGRVLWGSRVKMMKAMIKIG